MPRSWIGNPWRVVGSAESIQLKSDLFQYTDSISKFPVCSVLERRADAAAVVLTTYLSHVFIPA